MLIYHDIYFTYVTERWLNLGQTFEQCEKDYGFLTIREKGKVLGKHSLHMTNYGI